MNFDAHDMAKIYEGVYHLDLMEDERLRGGQVFHVIEKALRYNNLNSSRNYIEDVFNGIELDVKFKTYELLRLYGALREFKGLDDAFLLADQRTRLESIAYEIYKEILKND